MSAGSLALRRKTPRLPLTAGAAFIASVGYIDPGNFATNVAAGSHSGYRLLWVLVLANATAMLMQGLACRLSAYSGESLAHNCRRHLPLPVCAGLWLINEAMMVATDVAEIIGGAVGLEVLCGCPLVLAAVLIVIVSFGISSAASGRRHMETAMLAAVSAIACAYFFELLLAKPNLWLAAGACLTPRLGNDLPLAIAMLGATVMPHVIHLHSQLVSDRSAYGQTSGEQHLKAALADMIVALTLAGAINCAMVITFAHFSASGQPLDTLESAYRSLTPLFGQAASLVFGLALLISGLSSTVVGVMAGDNLVAGFLNRRLPAYVRRLVALVPVLWLLFHHLDPTLTLVVSQAVLSVSLPFTLIPLVWFNARADIVGRRLRADVLCIAALACLAIIALNYCFIRDTLAALRLTNDGNVLARQE